MFFEPRNCGFSGSYLVRIYSLMQANLILSLLFLLRYIAIYIFLGWVGEETTTLKSIWVISKKKKKKL